MERERGRERKRDLCMHACRYVYIYAHTSDTPSMLPEWHIFKNVASTNTETSECTLQTDSINLQLTTLTPLTVEGER